MERHPALLAILCPMWKVEGCRSVLHGMDDGLFVHQHADGRFEFQHRPMYRFVSRGRNSALSTLGQIASNLDAGYRFIIVDDRRFLRDLTALARARFSQNVLDDIQCALQVSDERASIVLLAIAATIGQLTQHRSAGSGSKAVMIAAERACPTAVVPPASQTVGDAEQTADRAMRWMILDRLMPQPLPRCRPGRRDGE